MRARRVRDARDDARPTPVRSRRAARAAVVAGATAALAIASLAPAGARDDAPAAVRRPWAGAASCARCHPKEQAAWEVSAHARSTVPATLATMPPEALRGGPVSHPPGSSAFRAVGEGILAETVGPDGKPLEVPVAIVVGGRRIQMFVARMPGGAHQVLPAMREVGTGVWFDYTHLLFGAAGLPPEVPPVVAPGDPAFWTGPVRSFDARCARCHLSGRESLPPGPDGRGPRSRWRSLGVDCEACHGPGEVHGRRWGGEGLAAGKDEIAWLGDLVRDRQLYVCFACHLEGTVVAPPGRITDDVLEYVDPTLLDDAERIDACGRPLELVYEGLSLLSSTCAERGRLTCGSCHDAHGGPHGASLRRPPGDDGLCAPCHASLVADPGAHAHHRGKDPGARCVGCHLPKVPTERGHGAVTDHTIGVPWPPRGGEARAAVDACTGCHAGARGHAPGAPRLDAAAIREAYDRWWPGAKRRPAWAAALEAGRRRDPAAAAALEALLADRTAPGVVRASAALLLGRIPGAPLAPLLAHRQDVLSLVRRAVATAVSEHAGPAADAALLAMLSDPSPPVRVHAARGALAGFERVKSNAALLGACLPVLAADADADPDDDLRWFRLGAAREIAGDLPGAIAAYERQVALDPFATWVRDWIPRLRQR